MILVVDDDNAILRLLDRLLQSEGFEVITASDGQEALNLAERHHPQVVLSDVSMPRLDGPGLGRALRERQGPARPKFVLMSALAGEHQNEADAFISKPFDLSNLIETVVHLTDAERN
jgi:two-component system response regulator MprA